MKLLYAEDERPLSEAVVDILTYHKYIVDAVYDGEDAYEYALSGDYDGIILDIMMPKKRRNRSPRRAAEKRVQNAHPAALGQDADRGPHPGTGCRGGRLSAQAL